MGQITETDPDATVLLIGSAARGRMTWRSDIDLMVITTHPLRRISAPLRIHLHPESRANFVQRLRDGDEFVSWATRFGRLLRDPSGWWEQVSQSQIPSPDWRQKLHHIGKRLRIARLAIKDGDREAAEEELMMAASHCGRALLLRRGSFPLSRPELPEQLAEAGELKLAGLLSRLIKGRVGMERMKLMFAALRKLHRRLRLQAASERSSSGRERDLVFRSSTRTRSGSPC